MKQNKSLKKEKDFLKRLDLLFRYKTRKFPQFFFKVVINTIISFFIALLLLAVATITLYSYIGEKKTSVGDWTIFIFLILAVIGAAIFAYIIYLKQIKKHPHWRDD